MRGIQDEISKQKANRSKKAKGKGKILMDFKRDLVTAIKRQTQTLTHTQTQMEADRRQSTGKKE